jgi:tetratricopeptide (TPR) repeat protein
MAKRPTRKSAALETSTSRFASARIVLGMPLLLASIAFLAYWPSLSSGFVYDARKEILEEGFITALSNLPAVLSFKVMGMGIILQDRPGQLLYMMLNAAVWGREPWGYHLTNNLLHAANTGLLYSLLRRLVAKEQIEQHSSSKAKINVAMIAVTLIFALHPLAVEPVAGISYCGDLLVLFFTLLALLAATAFRPDNFRHAILIGATGAACAFAAVICKESGLSTSLLLVAYWFLYRRSEPKRLWFFFLGAALTLTAVFMLALRASSLGSTNELVARLHFSPVGRDYLGGSFANVFLIQPRLWVLMMGKVIWPFDFSADYLLVDLKAPSLALSLVILVIVVSLQAGLAYKSKIGALGMACYWLSLITVSNFAPLYIIEADRFYYVAQAGVAMELLALLLLSVNTRRGFLFATISSFCLLVPLTFLTIQRQAVFANDLNLWSDTLRVSPHSSQAQLGLGWYYFQTGQVPAAIDHFNQALALKPSSSEVHYNLGVALAQNGQDDAAIDEYQQALNLNPNHAQAHYNLGNSLFEKGRLNDAIAQYQRALKINPNYSLAHNNLGSALLQSGQLDDAIVHFRQALAIDEANPDAHYNLGLALEQKGAIDEAIIQFQDAVQLNPGDSASQSSLAKAQEMAAHASGK